MRALIIALLGVFALSACDDGPTRAGHRINVGGTFVYIPLPDGYCRMDKSIAADKRFLRITRRQVVGRGKLMMAVARCDELKNWRAGGRRTLDNYGYVMAPLDSLRRRFRFTRSTFVKKFTRTLQSSRFKARARRLIADARRRNDYGAPGIRVTDAQILGVLKSNAYGVHVGVVQDILTEFGDPKRLAGSFGATLVREKVIFVYMYARYDGRRTVDRVLIDEEKWLMGIIASNG